MRKMADNLGQEWSTNSLEFVGDEWSDRKSLQEVLDDFVFPHLTSGCVAAEIGCGGGRVASR